MGPGWRQVEAKSGQRERRGGLRSDFGTKCWILKLVVFHWEYIYSEDKWRQVGDTYWKDEVNIAKGETKVEQRRQEAAQI